MNFVYESGDYGVFNWDSNDCTDFFYQQDIVGPTDFQDNTVDDHLAKTKSCLNVSGYMYNFRIAISDDYITLNSEGTKYYTGAGSTSDPNWTSNEFDLWGTLTHEFGHASGRRGISTEDGHFEPDDPNQACPSSNPEADSTMCEKLALHTAKWRTLTTHDISSFEDVVGYD